MAEENPEETPKSSQNKKLIIIAMGALVLGGATTYFGVGFLGGSGDGDHATTAEDEHYEEEAEEEPEDEYAPRRLQVKSALSLEPFLVNLADQDDVRFVKATFSLGLDQEGLGEVLKGDPIAMAVARDSILSILSSKFSDEILTPEGKDTLKQEIKQQVNTVLPQGKVRHVFIVDLVIQL